MYGNVGADSTVTNKTTKVSEEETFKKGIKCDASTFPVLETDAQWDN